MNYKNHYSNLHQFLWSAVEVRSCSIEIHLLCFGQPALPGCFISSGVVAMFFRQHLVCAEPAI
jgi:hypothetical protein